ncbi:MAG: hemolysin family protein [Actinomycetaceae bacterium]|nr:hemolysin family protein [Actinomycetaceae bacterium]
MSFLVFAAALSLFLTGLASALDEALARMTKARAEDLIEAGNKRAQALLFVMQRRAVASLCARALLSTFSVFATVCVVIVFELPNWSTWLTLLVSFLVAAVLTGLLSVLFGAYLGQRFAEPLALALAGAMRRLILLLRPVIESYMKLHPSPLTEAEMRALMAEDLKEMVAEMGEDEQLEIEDEDREMLRSVFELGTTLVREIMVPRTDMVSIDKDATGAEALALFVDSGFSRLPVIGTDFDDVRGVLVLKDVLGRTHRGEEALTAPVHQMMRTILFVPEMMLSDDLLRKMQANGDHMAMLVDEYGGISGLITLEDLIEELVGDLVDEHDHSEPEPKEIQGGWEVPAKMELGDLSELLGLEIDDEDVDTVAGLLAKSLGKVPLAGMVGTAQGLKLQAGPATGRRRTIQTVIVSKLQEPKNAISQ